MELNQIYGAINVAKNDPDSIWLQFFGHNSASNKSVCYLCVGKPRPKVFLGLVKGNLKRHLLTSHKEHAAKFKVSLKRHARSLVDGENPKKKTDGVLTKGEYKYQELCVDGSRSHDRVTLLSCWFIQLRMLSLNSEC